MLNKCLAFFLSGWQDSNLRPPRPKRGAITGLRYTPKLNEIDNLFFFKNLNFYVYFLSVVYAALDAVLHPKLVIKIRGANI